MKNVLVTGGVRGIGLAIALAFQQKGYSVTVTYSKDENSAIQAKNQGLRVIRSNVQEEKEVENLFSMLGHIDILVNNAGISLIKQLQDTTLQEWENVFAVNMRGAFLCSKQALKGMLKVKSGAIINISSVWGEVGGSCEVAYSASKAALIGFTKSLAKELAPSGITVNCVTPGVIDTTMNDCFTKEEKQAIIDEIPMGRMGTGKDVAQLVCDLSEQKYVTGQVIGVNGGY